METEICLTLHSELDMPSAYSELDMDSKVYPMSNSKLDMIKKNEPSQTLSWTCAQESASCLSLNRTWTVKVRRRRPMWQREALLATDAPKGRARAACAQRV